MRIYWKYFKSLVKHKWGVFRGGLIVGKIPLWRLVVHDWTKFTPWEFTRYAKNFQGDYSKSPVDRDQVAYDFHYAWLHHENHNPHHLGYWIPRTGEHKGKPLNMWGTYVYEMVADWLGASYAYTGSFDMTVWLEENLEKHKRLMSSWTWFTTSNLLVQLGYKDIVIRLNKSN